MQKMRDIIVEIDFSGVDALVFTSKNGVESFARRWDIRDIPAYCVGPATAEIAKSAGFETCAANGNSASLTNSVTAKNPLHIHGLHKSSRLDIGGHSVVIYEQVALPLDAETTSLLAAGKIDMVALFSPRSAQLLADVWQNSWPGPELYCISKATAAPVIHLGNVRISPKPSADSMRALLQQ